MLMKEETADSIINLFLWCIFFFFIVWGTYTILTKDVEFIFDRFFGAAVVLFFLLMYKKLHLSAQSIILVLLALGIHNLKLYGNVYLGLPFDRIMHFYAVFAISIAVFEFIDHCESEKCQRWWKIAFVTILVSIGIASLVEIMEFIGYSFLGEGEGILFYGTGDFGEWNNTSWDLISNSLGAIAGTILVSLKRLKKDFTEDPCC
jgi:hypothetical protein